MEPIIIEDKQWVETRMIIAGQIQIVGAYFDSETNEEKAINELRIKHRQLPIELKG